MESNSRAYNTGDTMTDELITALVEKVGHPETGEIVREMITSAVKFGQESDDRADLRLANAALKELRHSCKVFSSYRTTRKVIVFGSARSKPDSPEYCMAEQFSRMMGSQGFMVVTGGGPGVMEAGNKGAPEGMDFALNIRLPFEQKHNPYVAENEKLINYKYFFTRKLFFVKETDVTAVFPGGFGTLDETFEMLTLVQTGKSRPRPIVLMEPDGMSFWQECRAFIDHQLRECGFIGDDDAQLYTVAHSAEEAVAYISRFFRVYNSLRFDGNLTIMRLNQELSPGVLQRINKEFSDILTEGTFRAIEPTAHEVRDNDLIDLPRLGFHFNRKKFGRLYTLIHAINEG